MTDVIPTGFIEVPTRQGPVVVRVSCIVLVERDDNPATCGLLLVTGHWTAVDESAGEVRAKIAQVKP